jgi:2-methylcitrate dehydratase PrpD
MRVARDDRTVAHALATFAVTDAPVPDDVRDRLALHLLDVLGCGVAAVGAGVAGHAAALAIAQGGAPEASLIGASERVPAALAAFANGTHCHGLDFDDTHEAGICHASTVVGPAALAVGQRRGRSGGDVLDAYVRGCEVAVRIATVFADGAYARGFHPTGICGAFGATAAAARLEGLDERLTLEALGMAGSFASGLLEYLSDGSATKPIHAGWAAQAGVQAALLAASGAAGPARVIEGEFGLLASHGARPEDAGAIVGELGERWEAAAMSIKRFPACHFAHASTWAAAETVAAHGLRPGDIAEIVVRIPPAGEQMVLDPIDAKRRPRTPYDAKFSLPYTVAHHIVRGSLGLDAFSEASITDPEVLALAGRVAAEPLGPADGTVSRFGGGARTITRDGRELDRLLAHAPGSPGNPLDEASVLAKFRDNAELALPRERAEPLADAVRAITSSASLDAITDPLSRSRPR